MDTVPQNESRAVPWNKGKLLGQKPPLKPKEIWAIRIRLQLGHPDSTVTNRPGAGARFGGCTLDG